VEAAGGRLAGEHAGAPERRRAASGRGAREPVFALAGGLCRPDPGRGIFSTMLVRDGTAVDRRAHLERLRGSVRELYGQDLPDHVEQSVRAAAEPHRLARLRVLAAPAPGAEAEVGVEVHPIGDPRDAEPVRLAAAALPGGLGAHKWRDRRLLDELELRLGAVALLVDLDGKVLEAAHANVWIVEGKRLLTPPLDGRVLPGTVRARLLADPPAGLETGEEPIALERAAAAEELWLTSSIRGVHRAVLIGQRATPPASGQLVPAS
jgi:para-aminobenzoate synthetase / 4-amino-4-deoxychorismate lyase